MALVSFFFVGLCRGFFFFWLVYQTAERVKNEPGYLQYEGELIDLLGRLKEMLRSQRG